MKALAVIASAVGAVALIFGVAYFGLGLKAYFGPKYQNVSRQIFQQTRSYNMGMKQQLVRYMQQYNQADANGKQLICSTVGHMFASFNEDANRADLTNAEYSFLQKCKYGVQP